MVHRITKLTTGIIMTFIGYAYDYEQATKLRRPSPLVPALPGEMIMY